VIDFISKEQELNKMT